MDRELARAEGELAKMPKYSIVIPVKDEEDCVRSVVGEIGSFFIRAGVPFEIVAVLDGSIDSSEQILKEMFSGEGILKVVETSKTNRGFGSAINMGINSSSGDFVTIMMADGSDSPSDALKYYEEMMRGADCVFGTRFSHGGSHHGYPLIKWLLNRTANWLTKKAFRYEFDDTTNAFKAYTRATLTGISPIISRHFNITVEMPIKAILRGYSYKIVPVSWMHRKTGKSKLKIREMGSKYLLTCVYLWIENWLKYDSVAKGK